MSRKMMMIILVSSILSCTTVSRKSFKVALPAFLYEHFSDCSEGQKTSNFTLSRGVGSLTLNGEFDWIIRNNKDWQGEFVDGLGLTSSEIAVRDNKILLTGMLESYASLISVDSTGRILYRGFFTGFMMKELACVLSSKLPKSWKSRVTKVQNFPKELRVDYDSAGRQITSLIKLSTKDHKISVCNSIRWSNMLGMNKNTLQWCYTVDKKNKSEVSVSHSSGAFVKLRTQN